MDATKIINMNFSLIFVVSETLEATKHLNSSEKFSTCTNHIKT